MKNNFTRSEINILTDLIGKYAKIRINKAGNIEVKFNNTKNEEFFVLYYTYDKKYIWRRHGYYCFGGTYCYPLNMRRLDKVKHIWHSYYDNKEHEYYYRPYDINNSCFNSVMDAFDYFMNKYLKNHYMSPKGHVRYYNS